MEEQVEAIIASNDTLSQNTKSIQEEEHLDNLLQCDSKNNDDINPVTEEECMETNETEEIVNCDSTTPHSSNVLPDIKYSFNNIKKVAKYSHPSKKYFIGCKWSPDGTCLLSNCADNSLRLFDFPQEFHSLQKCDGNIESVINLKPSLEVKEGGLVYDYAWYPFMSSWNPPTCCFVTTSEKSPVHLWDAYTGKIRASYRAYDFADEVHAALSLCFSTNGEDIYCGFRNFVKIFDISKPGRQCESFNLKEISGQRGVVSCISENPSVPELFAVGTFSKTIGLYTRSHELVCMLTGQKSGLTQVMFSDDGSKLFSGARMDNEIICWDIRNLGKVLMSLERIVTTNQRIYFDLTKNNKYLISGGSDGNLHIWEIQEESYSKEDIKYLFKAGDDCINGVSMHCTYPIIATASGQRYKPNIVDDEDDQITFSDNSQSLETNITMWWAGQTPNDTESSEHADTECKEPADTENSEPANIEIEPT